jgi:hypothetical protein
MRSNPGLTMAASFENLGRKRRRRWPIALFRVRAVIRSRSLSFSGGEQVLVVHPAIRAAGDLAALRHVESMKGIAPGSVEEQRIRQLSISKG